MSGTSMLERFALLLGVLATLGAAPAHAQSWIYSSAAERVIESLLLRGPVRCCKITDIYTASGVHFTFPTVDGTNGQAIITNGSGVLSFGMPGGTAPSNASYITKSSESGLSAEFSLGSLTTGLLLNTVSGSTGTPSAYAGTSCTNQFPRSLNASGAATCASVASTDIAAMTSAALAGILSDETGGGGVAVFNSNPTLASVTISGTVTGAPTWASGQTFPTLTVTNNGVSITYSPAASDVGLDLGAGSTVRRMGSDGRLQLDSQTGVVRTTGVADATTGYRVNGAAASGHVLRGNGTNFVDATLASTDLSDTAALVRTTDLPLSGANGGTGVANTGKTITLGGDLVTSGAFAVTFTLTGATGVTLPTSGTLLANSRTINTTSPITGGGDLSADRTIACATCITSAVTSATGTANQVNVSASTGAVTFSLPQSIATSSSVQFAKVGIGVAPSNFLQVKGDAANINSSSLWQNAQVRVQGSTDANMQLHVGYDTTNNVGVIQSGQSGTAFTPLQLNPAGGGVALGATAVTMAAGEVGLAKITASGTAPGASTCKFFVVQGAAGKCTLQIACGTSATPVSIVADVGSGC